MMHKPPHKSQSLIFSKNTFERKYWQQGNLVCGIDEVGRGCLAGPLVTAAVILPIGNKNRLLQDSKVMTTADRLKAASWIVNRCAYGIGIVHHRLIDKHNIWQATLIAMRRAFVHLMAATKNRPGAILIDAMPLSLASTSFHEIPVHYFPKGESLSSSIAAASIIAKVKRDEIMARLDPLFPGYNFLNNKGYGTKTHLTALINGPQSLIHRVSFNPHVVTEKKLNKELNDERHQQCLC